MRKFLVTYRAAFLWVAPFHYRGQSLLTIFVLFFGITPRWISNNNCGTARTETARDFGCKFTRDGFKRVCMEQHVKELSSRLPLFAPLALVFRYPLQIRQSSFIINFARLLIMKECEVKAECCYPNRFLVNIHASDLFA